MHEAQEPQGETTKHRRLAKATIQITNRRQRNERYSRKHTLMKEVCKTIIKDVGRNPSRYKGIAGTKTLNIATYNCKGLIRASARTEIQHWMKARDIDILFLQETQRRTQ